MALIWDAHNHWMPPEVAEKTTFFKKGWSDSEALLRALDNSGIEKAVLLYPTSDAHINMGGWSKLCRLYNEALAEKVKAHPDRLIGAGILPVDSIEEVPKEMERIRASGLSALSLASSYDGRYLDDSAFSPVLEQAQRLGLPIFVHSQTINPIGFERIDDPLLMPVAEYLFDITMCAGKLMMSGVFTRYENLVFVFAHFAGVLPFLADRLDATYSMLRQRNIVRDLGKMPSTVLKNVYVDTSGVKSVAMMNMALEFFGPQRILWGSDYPAQKETKEGIAVFDALNIEEEDKNQMLAGNLAAILK